MGYQWTIRSGESPPGLSLSAEGTPAATLSGTPTEDGAFIFSVQVTDSGGESVSHAYSVTIADAPPPLRISTALVPNGIQGIPYDVTLRTSGGTGTGHTWRVLGGDLPMG